MKLEAADWLKTITQIREAITFLQKLLTLNIIQTVYSNYMEREKLIKKKITYLSGSRGRGLTLNSNYLQ